MQLGSLSLTGSGCPIIHAAVEDIRWNGPDPHLRRGFGSLWVSHFSHASSCKSSLTSSQSHCSSYLEHSRWGLKTGLWHCRI